MARKRIPIDRRDYTRVLLTETLPHETPLIFSADGLYDWLRRDLGTSRVASELLKNLVTAEPSASVPFHYKVRKTAAEYRRLSVLHPRAQWQVRLFYEKYETLLLYFCAQSPASIRAPHRIAGSFFQKSSWENIRQFKREGVATLEMEEIAKHSPSFFAYKGFDRLYKFFESRDYFELEKRFDALCTLDVSKCFDSIYTHCLSWAVKDKEFTKRHRPVVSTFGEEFDSLMRQCNHDETNGIVIGPEVSRIFAEVIFQQIDLLAIERLLERTNYRHNVDYVLRRYVDDLFIFSATEKIGSEVYDCYADVLTSFNLHANVSKSSRLSRPFITAKSRLVHSVSKEANEFFEKFLASSSGTSALVPKDIRSKWRLTRSFTESVKGLCSETELGYDDVSPFVLAMIAERVKKLVNNDVGKGDEVEQRRYADALLTLLDAGFFLHAVAPTVPGSYKLCTCLTLTCRFAAERLPKLHPTIAHRLYELLIAHFTDLRTCRPKSVDRFVPLESLNLLLAARDLGRDFLLPPAVVSSLFDEGGLKTYFDIACCLYYVRDEVQYESLRARALDAVNTELADLRDVRTNAGKALLLLDISSCPYVPLAQKRALLGSAFAAFQTAKPTKTELNEFLEGIGKFPWHVDWSEVDLLNALEKKELKSVYR